MGPKIGRNAPCPCGSGQKYKKCCLPGEEAAAREAAMREAAARQPAGREPAERLPSYESDLPWLDEPDDLDELSNGVLDLIREGRFDEADAVCAQLREKYPEVVDGVWRQAMVYEARGMNREAARCYREAADFARANEGFEEEGIQHWLETADRLDPPAES